MDIKELRLGNIVGFKKIDKDFNINPGENIIDEKLMQMLLVLQTVKNAIFPISLTEEWLLKTGFKPTTSGYWSNGKLEVGYTTSDENIQYEYLSITGRTEMTDMKYVHQLQNLYFTLVGEEL